jgi:transcriptional regulator with XRE-family HTH domain
LTSHQDGWYYLTMSYRVTWHPLDDPTLYRIAYIRGSCSALLRETRRTVGFSQRALSAASGVSLSTVAKAEQGRQNLSMDTLAKLMDAMGMALVIRTRFRSASEIGVDTDLRQDVSIDVGPKDTDDVSLHDEDDHEEDDPPDPTDPSEKTEEELEQEIIREITRAR